MVLFEPGSVTPLNAGAANQQIIAGPTSYSQQLQFTLARVSTGSGTCQTCGQRQELLRAFTNSACVLFQLLPITVGQLRRGVRDLIKRREKTSPCAVDLLLEVVLAVCGKVIRGAREESIEEIANQNQRPQRCDQVSLCYSDDSPDWSSIMDEIADSEWRPDRQVNGKCFQCSHRKLRRGNAYAACDPTWPFVICLCGTSIFLRLSEELRA